jgi:hypothetical protein
MESHHVSTSSTNSIINLKRKYTWRITHLAGDVPLVVCEKEQGPQ